MGLDMYLTAKKYLWSDKDKELSAKINELVGVEADMQNRWNGSSMIVKEISLDAMYWRKANAIHGWFVRRCQGGKDECQLSYVSREQLQELVELCHEALDKPDHEVLEPTEGFFFGSYEKDEWYYQYLKETIEGITKVLTLPEKEYEFYYQASW
jgi:hypothetical protein